MLKQTLKYTLLFLYALIFFLFTGCGKETNTENHLPKAAFDVHTDLVVDSCYRGDVNTVFYFDASLVCDKEDPLELLQVKWDFTNSGLYTEYTTDKKATHKYTEIGLYFPMMKVRDTKGMVDSIKKMIVVVSDLNKPPPSQPIYISPTDWQNYIDPTHVFKWSCAKTAGEELTFDFWLGTRKASLTLFEDNIETSETTENGKVVYTTTLSGLDFSQDYYWQIYARDVAGNYTPGYIWKFTTAAQPPE